MPFVIDASVTAAWLLPDEPNDFAERCQDVLIEDDAFVPAIWPIEMRNMLIVAERRGRTSESATNAALKYLDALPILVDFSQTDDNRLMEMARTHKLSAYDASYLELALRRGMALATLDARLLQAARSLDVELLT